MSEKHKYEYKCIDNSVLTPPFRKYVAAPVLQWVPVSINPNLITVVSSVFSLIALFLSYHYGQGAISSLLIALLIFLYLLSDHLDGMQAKRRGGGTALGEFLDHFLDVLNNGIFLLILVNIFQIKTDFVLLSMFGFGYITQSAVFFEQYKTGWIVFGKYESFEAVVILILIVALSGITPLFDSLVQNSINGLMLVEWIFLLTSMSGTTILYIIYQRVGKGMVEFLWLILAVLVMLVSGYFSGNIQGIFPSICLGVILVTQEYMISRLTHRKNSWVVFAMPVLFVGFVLFIGVWGFNVLLIGICFIRFVNTVYVLTKELNRGKRGHNEEPLGDSMSTESPAQ